MCVCVLSGQKSKMGKNMVTRWQPSGSESLSLFFKREAPNFKEFIVSCLRTEASKEQSWDQSIHVWSPEIVPSPRHPMADDEARARRDFHYLNMQSDKINLDQCPSLSLSAVCVLPLPSALRNRAFTLSFLGVPNSNAYMESFGKLWKDTCLPVLNSAFLGCPNFLDHIMTLLLVKSMNFVPISYAVECVEKSCFMADGVTIDQRVFNEATKTNFTQLFHKSFSALG